MTKMALIIGIVAIVAVGALLLAGFHPRYSFAHGDGRYVDHFVEKAAKKLDLTADQKKQLTQIAAEIKTTHQKMRASHQTAKEQLRAELRKESIDRETLDAIYGDTKNRFDTIYDLMATKLVAFHQTLTPEQREKLATEMEKHHDGHRCGFHRWHKESS